MKLKAQIEVAVISARGTIIMSVIFIEGSKSFPP